MPALLVVGLALTCLVAGCDGASSSAANGPGSSPTSSAATQLPPEELTVGVIGTGAEARAYRRMADDFRSQSRRVTVHVETYPDENALITALQNGAPVPDVFWAGRRDLAWLDLHQMIQPVDGLLDDRGVDFGDDYPRETLTGFGSDNHLLCLPYSIEPSVVYYNRRLLDLGAIHSDPPTPGQGWSLDQFRAAASWATRNHPGVRGVYVDPTLAGVLPFLYSGGGQLFDNNALPTSTVFSGEGSQQALTQSMRVLANPGLVLPQDDLGSLTPEQWFERGRLAMLVGSRALVPELRAHPSLHFDVMPMPTLVSPATAGQQTGLCISRTALDSGTAADFLVYASSPPALDRMARTGYVQPANQTVALSDAFLQPGLPPRHAEVFTFGVKSMVYPPLIDRWNQLETSLDPLVGQLFQTRDAADILDLSRRIDRRSKPVLAPLATESPSPTASAQAGG